MVIGHPEKKVCHTLSLVLDRALKRDVHALEIPGSQARVRGNECAPGHTCGSVWL